MNDVLGFGIPTIWYHSVDSMIPVKHMVINYPKQCCIIGYYIKKDFMELKI